MDAKMQRRIEELRAHESQQTIEGLRASDHTHAFGEPVASVLARHEDDSPVSVFWESVDEFGLRQPGEDDAELIHRLEIEAVMHYSQSIS